MVLKHWRFINFIISVMVKKSIVNCKMNNNGNSRQQKMSGSQQPNTSMQSELEQIRQSLAQMNQKVSALAQPAQSARQEHPAAANPNSGRGRGRGRANFVEPPQHGYVGGRGRGPRAPAAQTEPSIAPTTMSTMSKVETLNSMYNGRLSKRPTEVKTSKFGAIILPHLTVIKYRKDPADPFSPKENLYAKESDFYSTLGRKMHFHPEPGTEPKKVSLCVYHLSARLCGEHIPECEQKSGCHHLHPILVVVRDLYESAKSGRIIYRICLPSHFQHFDLEEFNSDHTGEYAFANPKKDDGTVITAANSPGKTSFVFLKPVVHPASFPELADFTLQLNGLRDYMFKLSLEKREKNRASRAEQRTPERDQE
jgi:hypothetical protein